MDMTRVDSAGPCLDCPQVGNYIPSEDLLHLLKLVF